MVVSTSSLEKEKRVTISHTRVLPCALISGGNVVKGAALRTIANAALSHTGLPELRSTRGPPSIKYKDPS